MTVARQGFEGGSYDRVSRLWTLERWRLLERHHQVNGIPAYTSGAIAVGQKFKDDTPQTEQPSLEQWTSHVSGMGSEGALPEWLQAIVG